MINKGFMNMLHRQRFMARTRFFTPSLTITTLALALAACQPEPSDNDQANAPQVTVATVQPEKMTLWDTYSGNVAAPDEVTLRARVSGYIDHISFTEGDMVKQGDVLFTIDQRPYQARVNAAKAALNQAQTEYDLAHSEAERMRHLIKSSAVSHEEYEQRIAAEATAKAQIDAARADLDTAQLDLTYTQVKAPISGKISRADVTRGNLVTANSTVLTHLVSTDPMYIYFDVSEDAYVRYQQQQHIHTQGQHLTQVNIQLAGQQHFPYHGQLDFVDNQLNQHTGTMRLRAVVSNDDQRLTPGLFARVQVPAKAPAKQILIAEKAIMTDQDIRYVWVVDSDHHVARRNLQLGRKVLNQRVVRSGLNAGDQVVINGLQRIAGPGAEVAPQAAKTLTASHKQ